MRVTAHNGRVNKDGTAYCVKHNDRRFDLSHAPHIDADRTADNRYWHCYQNSAPEMSLADAERTYYAEHFSAGIGMQNARNEQARHPERNKTIDDLLKNPRTCPEETILQIGKIDAHVSARVLWECAVEQINWERERYPQRRVLDIALHMDESTPHIHVRAVWVAHDCVGNEIVSQNKALDEMRVGLPDASKPKDRHNNPKMTYTRAAREHLVGVCRAHGIEIETDPLEASKRGLELTEYKRRREEERLAAARAEYAHLQQRMVEMEARVAQAETELEKRVGKIKRDLFGSHVIPTNKHINT